ncbi:rho GTPase-activating protein 33-like [Pollicipes pollicipes]|uniref:rho GTPase-activating protein 33-like n=1 Tax=Pollicipes pollicipes TaxID=41117 RepID=UPI001884CCF1|nr:rho GTPase-activating protein 33-like [Pollicipes pollicipes]
MSATVPRSRRAAAQGWWRPGSLVMRRRDGVGGSAAAIGSVTGAIGASEPGQAGLMSYHSVDGSTQPRRARELSSIDPAYTSQSGLTAFSDLATSRGSVRIQHFTGQGCGGAGSGDPRIYPLVQCAHFHYEHVELSEVEVQLHDGEPGVSCRGQDQTAEWADCLALRVASLGRHWVVMRSLDHLRLLDSQLHTCVFDRRYSRLPLLTAEEEVTAEDGASEAVQRAVYHSEDVLPTLNPDITVHDLYFTSGQKPPESSGL